MRLLHALVFLMLKPALTKKMLHMLWMLHMYAAHGSETNKRDTEVRVQNYQLHL